MISVVVPSLRRPAELRRCLEGLTRQEIPAAEVLVVARSDDGATLEVAREFAGVLPLRTVPVSEPGQVAALNAGRAAAAGDIVAITDDDCVPTQGWLAAIARRLSDPAVGGVGGRDVVHFGEEIDGGATDVVGRITWYGRTIGRHQLDAPAQQVRFLKGANMAYRREALPWFDKRLLGAGAQVCNDMAASMAVARDGWQLWWDPAVRVDHYPAQRFDEDARNARSLQALSNEQHNELYVLLRHARVHEKLTALLSRLLIGPRYAPGLVRGVVAVARPNGRSRSQVLRLMVAVTRARLRACRTACRAARDARVTATVGDAAESSSCTR
jgi:glycosyltransferase involved in cell wall biosynthesis